MPYGFTHKTSAETAAIKLRDTFKDSGYRYEVMPYDFKPDSYTHSFKESDVIKWGVGMYSPKKFEGFFWFPVEERR